MFISRLVKPQISCAFRNNSRVFRRCYAQKSINLSDPSVQNYLDNLVKEHESLLTKQEERSSVEIRRLREIKYIASVVAQKKHLQKYIASIKDSIIKEEDEELKKMMMEECKMNSKRAEEVETQLLTMLLEPFLTKNGILLEIVAAEGHDAQLFAKQLLQLYMSYAKFKNWSVEVASVEEFKDGYKRASMLIDGLGTQQLMNLETGVHHRISSEDQDNRISTVIVSLLVQPSDLESDVPTSELSVERFGKNTSFRVTHVPTGTSVTCKENKSNKLNEHIAMRELATLLFHRTEASKEGPGGLISSDSIIRTYDFGRDRVLDRRGGDTQHQLQTFMEGKEVLERVQNSLLRSQHYENIIKDIRKFDKEKDKRDDVRSLQDQ